MAGEGKDRSESKDRNEEAARLRALLEKASADAARLEKENGYFHGRLDELSGQTIRLDSVVSRAKRELRQRREALGLLSELQLGISTDLPKAEIYSRTVAATHKTLKMDRTILLEAASEPRTFRPAIWLGSGQSTRPAPGEATIEFPDPFVEAGARLLVTSETPPTEFIATLRASLGVPFFVCVPVLVGGAPAAQLLTGRMREAKPFFPPLDEGDVSTLQSVAGFLGAALHNAELYRHVERMAGSFARFVPAEFLRFLQRRSIVDVELGDQTQQEMTILFSDIRSFTTMSERMNPKETFDFINEYLRHAGPVVRENHGFIDKYIGDAIMALFPGRAEDAVRAAIGLQGAVRDFNRSQGPAGRPPIAIGVGLHTGTLMLGTIGFAERMESTVISDAVNLASRMEGLTKTYGAGVLVSGAVLARIEDPSRFRHRLVDRVLVKGKAEPVDVFDVFESDSHDQIDRKRETRAAFEEGFAFYQAARFEPARASFLAVLASNPQDKSAALLRDRCQDFLDRGAPAGWNGVTALDHK